jgi:signal peptidase
MPGVLGTVARHGATVLRWCLLGFACGIGLALVVSVAFGWRSLTDMSDSMAPAIKAGDVVVARPINPLSARVGDIVTFRDPNNGRRTITHRVRGIRVEGELVLFTTKGDANNTNEEWTVPVGGHISRVLYRVARVGYVLRTLDTPPARIALVAVPLLALGGMALRSIWRDPRDPTPIPPAHAAVA